MFGCGRHIVWCLSSSILTLPYSTTLVWCADVDLICSVLDHFFSTRDVSKNIGRSEPAWGPGNTLLPLDKFGVWQVRAKGFHWVPRCETFPSLAMSPGWTKLSPAAKDAGSLSPSHLDNHLTYKLRIKKHTHTWWAVWHLSYLIVAWWWNVGLSYRVVIINKTNIYIYICNIAVRMGLVAPSTVGIQWYPYRPNIMRIG